MKKAAIMARVSSEEQANGYSLDSQIDQLRRYCDLKDIEIVYEFREEHSAKTFERPAFKDFLRIAKKHKGMFDSLLFISWDRFSRNCADSFLMIRNLNEMGIEAQAITQPIDTSIPENKFMLAYYLTSPEVDNDRRSIKIKDGIRMALQSGRFVSVAPRGYINGRDERRKPLLVPDPIYAPLIKQMFELANAEMSQSKIRVYLQKKGLFYSRNGISVALRNPVYMGKIVIRSNDLDSAAQMVSGIHEPLISEELFYGVQDKLNKNVDNKRKVPKNKKLRPEMPLKGLITCSKCNNLLTGSRSKSQTGAFHFYYHCNYCRKERIKAPKINAEVEQVLQLFDFKKNPTELFQTMLTQYLCEDDARLEREKQELSLKLAQADAKLNDLQSLFIEGKLEFAEFQMLKAKLIAQRSKFKLTNAASDGEIKEFKAKFINSLSLMKNLPETLKTMDLDSKFDVLSSIFPEKIQFDGKNCRTPKINKALLLILAIDEGSGGKAKRDKLKKMGLSLKVEPAGVEPASKQGIHTLSTCLFPDYLSRNGRTKTNQPFP